MTGSGVIPSPEDRAPGPLPGCQSVTQMADWLAAVFCDLDAGHQGRHEATVTIAWESEAPVPP